MKTLPVNMSSIPVFSPSTANAATNKTQTSEGQASQIVFSSSDAQQPPSSREHQEAYLLQEADSIKVGDVYAELRAESLKKGKSFREDSANAYLLMEKGVQEVMETIALEMPKIFTKDFDFTRTAEGIEIVDHELTTEEYNYVKYVANNNQNLLDGADKFNQYIADAKTYHWLESRNETSRLGDDPIFNKESVEGRINLKSYMEDLAEYMWENGSPIVENRDDIYERNYRYRGYVSMDAEMVRTVSAEISGKV